jgi:hypothetical protein
VRLLPDGSCYAACDVNDDIRDDVSTTLSGFGSWKEEARVLDLVFVSMCDYGYSNVFFLNGTGLLVLARGLCILASTIGSRVS